MSENNLFDLKKRVTAAKQTRKITSTMELIASSRMHRGKLLLASFRDWSKHMHKAALCLPDRYFEPLSDPIAANKKAYIVFGGSKGLSGAYGPNLFQYAAPMVEDGLILAVGTAAEDFFPDAHTYFGHDTPSHDGAGVIARAAMDLYESREVSEVYIIYMRGTAQVSDRLLPLVRTGAYRDMVLMEPSRKALCPVLLQAVIETMIYEAHLHAFVAEQMARVSAMDSATQNADDIIEGLQSTYNRIRQSTITQEIIMVSNATRGGGA